MKREWKTGGKRETEESKTKKTKRITTSNKSNKITNHIVNKSTE